MSGSIRESLTLTLRFGSNGDWNSWGEEAPSDRHSVFQSDGPAASQDTTHWPSCTLDLSAVLLLRLACGALLDGSSHITTSPYVFLVANCNVDSDESRHDFAPSGRTLSCTASENWLFRHRPQSSQL